MTAQERKASAEERAVAEEIWLNYFNRYLFEHGAISQRERNRMTTLIAERKGRKPRAKSKSRAR